jgi:hypothetical protein
MRTKMLLGSALMMLASCAEQKPPNIPEVAAAGPVADLNAFDAEDTAQELRAKAEARGAAQAKSDFRRDAQAEDIRQNK